MILNKIYHSSLFINKIILIQRYWKRTHLESCPICYGNKILVKGYDCTHNICRVCVRDWDAINPSCPLCRSNSLYSQQNNLNIINDTNMNENNLNDMNENNMNITNMNDINLNNTYYVPRDNLYNNTYVAITNQENENIIINDILNMLEGGNYIYDELTIRYILSDFINNYINNHPDTFINSANIIYDINNNNIVRDNFWNMIHNHYNHNNNVRANHWNMVAG